METEQKVGHVIIDRMDGSQVRVDAEDTVWAHRKPVGVFKGEPIGGERSRVGLAEIPSLLSRPNGWIEVETEARYEPEEEWRDASEWSPATHRIYARAVVSVLSVAE